MRHKKAIAILARSALWTAYEIWVEEGWANAMPDIGEYDFERVVKKMEALLPKDPFSQIEKAYTQLSENADELD